MPKKIITEAARIALAHREFEQNVAKIRRKLNARSAKLKRESRATNERSFHELCEADPEIQELLAKLDFREVWRDFVIDFHCIPSVEEDGRIRWSLPDSNRMAN
jgi:hypothetical protein